ncbi:MAG TPA: glycerol-3-phosphate dehydrogenase/oxidase [Parafilimonas sp.]|nr:glycerol-3-phosphate dehydrogenase/oxidase [Parafilimonas sp.]
MNRVNMLQQVAESKTWDVLIIGGGATGLGAALDSASRGYSTLLLEASDFAKGTSSRSTKLVHGGVRYLEQGNIKLVREALRERGWLLQNAPGITQKRGFIIPAFSWVQKIYYGTGLKVYDTLSGKLALGGTKFLSKKETIKFLPGLIDKKLTGGIVYFDGQFDDARLAIALAKTAVQHGAVLLNHFKVISLLKANGNVGAVAGVDTLSRKIFEIRAKTVINATGVFTDDILKMDDGKAEEIVTPSQGIHLVVDKKNFPGDHALMIPETDDKRVLFAVPWHNKLLIGTTDTPVEHTSLEPRPLEEEIQFVIKHANRYLRAGIQEGDITSMFAGLRPLVKMKGVKKTSLLSRDHTIIVSTSGLVSITGGKWTTYRKMAEDAVNNAIFVGKFRHVDCKTQHLPIEGSKFDRLDYSNEATLEKIYSTENIRSFIQDEMAMTVEDVLARRTRLLFLDAKKAIEFAPLVALEMATVFQHDQQWIQKEIDNFISLAQNYVPHLKLKGLNH